MMATRKEREEAEWHKLYREYLELDSTELFQDFLVSKILDLFDRLELEAAKWNED